MSGKSVPPWRTAECFRFNVGPAMPAALSVGLRLTPYADGTPSCTRSYTANRSYADYEKQGTAGGNVMDMGWMYTDPLTSAEKIAREMCCGISGPCAPCGRCIDFTKRIQNLIDEGVKSERRRLRIAVFEQTRIQSAANEAIIGAFVGESK